MAATQKMMYKISRQRIFSLRKINAWNTKQMRVLHFQYAYSCGLMTEYMCVIGEKGKWKEACSALLTVPQNQKLGIKAKPY